MRSLRMLLCGALALLPAIARTSAQTAPAPTSSQFRVWYRLEARV